MTAISDASSRTADNPTLERVAQLAQVSLTTASRVLSGSSHKVSKKTREQVLSAAKELGYAASPLARALASKRSRIIGVIVPDNVDSYFAEIARGVDDVANEAGYLTIMCNTNRESSREIAQLQMLRTYNAAGVVFAGSGRASNRESELSDLVPAAQHEGMAVISLGQRDFESGFVGYDNIAAMRELTNYLIRLGHRDIVFITGLDGVYSADARLAGYQEAMTAAGLEPRIIKGTYAADSGTTAAVSLIGQGTLPDAVIGANDQTAIAALTAFRHAGIAVPEDMSVVGMGGTRTAALVDLTTSAPPLGEMGAMAARRIISGLASGEEPRVFVPSQIVIRQTSARRRASMRALK